MTLILAACSSSKASEPAPDFDLESVRAGQPRVSLAALRGKPVVLNFWASWCVPCERELPAFETEHKRVGRRIAFVGVDGQDSRRNAVALLDKAGVTFPSGYDPNDSVYHDYHLIGRPVTVFIGPDGHIKGRHAGQLSGAELRRLLDRFFAPA